MICAELKTFNSGLGSAQAFSPVEPQPSDYSTCTYVIQSGNESIGLPALTVTDGTQIAVAIATVWAIGAVFRLLIDMFRGSAAPENEHSS